MILGKCTGTIPGRHQKTQPIWPWLLQCIQCCQESRSVITATQCMKHSLSFTFYFLHLQTKACPASFSLPPEPTKPQQCIGYMTGHPEPWEPSAKTPCFGSCLFAQCSANPCIPPTAHPVLCESYGDSAELAPHRNYAPENAALCENTDGYFK